MPRRFRSFDLCGGVLVGARTPSDNDGEAHADADDSDDAAYSNPCELLGTTLPSVLSGDVHVRNWSRNVGFAVYGLGIDAEQDLAVVIQSRTTT